MNRFNVDTQTFTRFGKRLGLPETVVAIQEDTEGNLWLASATELLKFHLESEKIQKYTLEDGLPAAGYNEFEKTADGVLFLPSANGFVRFHPDSIKENTFLPNVVITDLLLFNKSVKDTSILPQAIGYTKEITLHHDQYIFSLEFAALNLRQSHKNRYKYKMQGLSEQWIETDARNPRATYTNLDAGTYTFMVKASNDDGFWNETPTILSVVILPPWYLTLWAKVLWGTLVIGSILAFYFWRVNTLKQQKLVLEQEVKDRTEEIATQAEELLVTNEKLVTLNQFREDMGNMVVHDFKAPLNSILWYGKENDKVLAPAQRLQNLLENFLDVHRFEEAQLQVDLIPLRLSELIVQAMKQTESLGVAKSIQMKQEVAATLYVNADQELVLRVLENLLSNAIKYSPTQGEIYLKAEVLAENQIRVAVSDEGNGIPQNQLAGLFDKYAQVDLRKSGKIRSTGLGLTFCKIAIEAQEGEIWVESEEGKGSSFYFTLQQADHIPKTFDIANQEEKILEKEASLSLVEKELIASAVKALQAMEDIQLSDIHQVMRQVTIPEKGQLAKWKKELLAASFAANKERVEELLALAQLNQADG